MEDCKRQRSESSTGEEVSHPTHIAVSYIDKHYPQYKSVSTVVRVVRAVLMRLGPIGIMTLRSHRLFPLQRSPLYECH